MLEFLQKLALDSFHIFVCNFSREIFADKCIENLKKKKVLGLLAHVTPSIFFSGILKSEALVYSSYIF